MKIPELHVYVFHVVTFYHLRQKAEFSVGSLPHGEPAHIRIRAITLLGGVLLPMVAEYQ